MRCDGKEQDRSQQKIRSSRKSGNINDMISEFPTGRPVYSCRAGIQW